MGELSVQVVASAMSSERDSVEDTIQYDVVVNGEQQYSVWFADEEPPSGWSRVGVRGPRPTCLEHIAKVWTDLRPATARERPSGSENDVARPTPRPAPDLVTLLTEPQPVHIGARPTADAASFRQQVERGLVFVVFPATGTELPVRLDRQASRLGGVASSSHVGTATVVGELSLDGARVRCHAEIDGVSLRGTGRVERLG